ncbi:MAG: hypothetical protein R2734_14045 [Nocardioides sp.]
MSRTTLLVIVSMVALVVIVDVVFFRHHCPGAGLLVNVGIVAVFGAFYLRFLAAVTACARLDPPPGSPSPGPTPR